VVSAHVLVEDSSAEDLLERITAVLREDHGAYFSTVQLEHTCVGEEPSEIDFLQRLPQDQLDQPAAPASPHHDGHEGH